MIFPPEECQRRVGIGGDLDERYFLEIAVTISGLRADFLELRFEVSNGFFLSVRRGRAALELVGAQNLDMLDQTVGGESRKSAIDVLIGRGSAAGKTKGG